MSDTMQEIAPFRAIVPLRSSVLARLIPNDDDINPRNFRRIGAWAIIISLVTMLVLVGCVALNQSPREGAKIDPVVMPSITTTTPVTTWAMVKSGDYEHNRWFGKGVNAINLAKTPAQAREAANTWLEGVKVDATLLRSASLLMLHNDISKAKLVDKAGMATTQTVATYIALKDLFATSEIVVDEAPVSGYNTGIMSGSLVRARNGGITGNRKAIRITTPRGEAFWILGRCGNIVTPGKPSLPPGDTDEGKDPSQDPFARGNAPVGGGKNHDSGPGTYVKPSDMVHPPATPRVNPTVPPVTTPPTGSAPDPTPAPAPEPQAPTPDAPATGHTSAPGTS